MKTPLNSIRLLVEIVLAVAAAEFAVMFILPLIAHGVNEAVEAGLDAALLSVIAGPLILWRVRVTARRASLRCDAEAVGTRRLAAMVGIIVVGGIGLSAMLAINLHRSIMAKAQERFMRVADRETATIADRVNKPVYGLKGARGVYAASKSVERDEFRAYVASRDLAREFPGALGFGFIQRVMRSDLDAFVAAERADDAPEFSVRSAPTPGSGLEEAPDLYVIKYIEPLEPNRATWGNDAGSEPVRRAALERAVRTGEPTITGKLNLEQDHEGRTGFFYFVPVYRNGASPRTPEEREAALVGLVYAPILLEDALASRNDQDPDLVDIELFDGERTTTETMLMDRDGDLAGTLGEVAGEHDHNRVFSTRGTLHIGGRTWTAVIRSAPAFEKMINWWLAPVTGVGGSLLAMLAGCTLWSLGTSRARAEVMVQTRTGELLAAKTRAEEALREVAAFRNTLDHHSIISVADRSGRITDVNPQFCTISGYSREELLGQDHRVLNSGHHPKEFWVQVWKTIASGRPWRGEVCNRAKDGSLYWVDSIIAPFMDATGRIEKYVSIRNDITARKLAEQRITESEQRLRTIVDAEPECVKVLDIDGTLRDMNPAGLRMLDAESTEQVRELGLDHFVGVDYREKFHELHRLVCQGVSGSLTFEAIGLRGTRRWLDTHAVPLRDAAGTITAVLAVTRDITEQVRHRNAVHEQAERLDMTVRCANLGTWDWDIPSGTVHFNDVMQTMLGYTPGEWASCVSAWEALVHPEDMPSVRQSLDDHMAGRTAEYRCEHRLRRKDGSWAWILDVGRVTERDDSGRATRMLGVHIDVDAARRAAQALLVASEQANAANRAKSEFLANMSHEIRTPLTAILGFADLLREDEGASMTPAQRIATIDTIRGAGMHLLTIINDILDLSKIEAEKLTVERIECPLLAILNEVVGLARPGAQAKGIELAVTLETPIPDRIIGDPTRLRQILMNLVGNAVKFTEAGTVNIKARAEQHNGAAWLVADVIDTGPGMTSEQGSRLFQAFTQADSTVTRRHGGTGLGLTICRRLAALMGGGVMLAATEPGKGSTFRLELPMEMAPGARWIDHVDTSPAAQPDDAANSTVRLNGRVLLAEDGVDNQRLISFHLRKAGATVDIAENGRVALELITASNAAGRPYDLLLSDMQMPEMDGYTLARELRGAGCHVPIIALTAHTMADDRRRCLDAGCDDYATKPIDKRALLASCAAWMGRQSGATAAAA